jgi:serine protease AprX
VLDDRHRGDRSDALELEPLVLVDLLDEMNPNSDQARKHWTMPTHKLVGRACAVLCALGAAAPSAATATRSSHPEYLVQLRQGISQAAGRHAIAAAGGRVTRDLHIIHAFGARLSRPVARSLRARPQVASVVRNSRMEPSAATTSLTGTTLLTAFNQSLATDRIWSTGATGKNVTVAVIDTGIAGALADFRTSQSDASSRVIASVVTNPEATSAGDGYGHGTHVAGLIAGNGFDRASSDPLFGRYAGTAPNARLVSIKASDEHGDATVLDVIYGLQFAVDQRGTYGIRVVNLSLESAAAQSAKTDPLDAAVEQAWLHGLVVVAAAGNRGTAVDAVSYAPGNDPYAISVGAVDDLATKNTKDDVLASWSSRGKTQDGVSKPDVLAPGAHLVSMLAPGSDFAALCPTCVVSGQYIRLGGTSMAAAVTSGVVADLLQIHPTWTPDQVKAVLMGTARTVTSGKEVAADMAVKANPASQPNPNLGLTPNTLLDPATGDIDYARASWGKASWSTAADALKASWSKASWSCACSRTATGDIDPTRASWSRASWSAAWDK